MWNQEHVFSKVPIRRLAIYLNTKESVLGSKQLNPFHFCSFNLEQICSYQNGLLVSDSPINTTDVKLLNFKTMSDLSYIDNGLGISLSEYPNNYSMFLISPALRRLIFLTLNLKIVQFQLNLTFQSPCPVISKFSLLVRKQHNFFCRFCPESFKKSFSDKLMDEKEINNLSQGCKLFKYKFVGVFAADNLPVNLSRNSFIIVNVSAFQSIGTHWTLICRKKRRLCFCRPHWDKI